ncbi:MULTISPECIES: alpha/beta hydrolase family protein [Rufibacter]|uniref:Acetyl esterase/lipase n=1 Tax=Rufibacter quisquiliarum TaxID=1549639 RepID=A0A839GUT5_9BACT|nr:MULTISPECIES: alpha/beta fold hydrolase [Rufibacter]MBA9079245.1 acetyl esterase/lipase [Rufibacter quisquiliarum]
MKNCFYVLLLVLCLKILPVHAQSPPPLVSWQDLMQLPAPTTGVKIQYGPDSLQFGELRVPATGQGPFPVVVVIHGGCWLSQYNYAYMNHLSAALTKAGYATWNVEFRRVGNLGGGWPGTFLDVGKAIDYVPALAKNYPLNKKQVVVLGHSAGGHLALWAATRQKLPKSSPLYAQNPLKITGVVSLAGITDLVGYSQEKGSCNAAVEKLMGGLPSAVPERYADGSPLGRIPVKVPVRLLQGALDPIVPVQQAEQLAAYSSNKNYRVQTVLLPFAGHFDLVAPTSPAWLTVEKAVREVGQAAARN